jgi:hypothetical protein
VGKEVGEEGFEDSSSTITAIKTKYIKKKDKSKRPFGTSHNLKAWQSTSLFLTMGWTGVHPPAHQTEAECQRPASVILLGGRDQEDRSLKPVLGK